MVVYELSCIMALVGTVTIASSLMGGSGSSHEHVEDGCKATCVKLKDEGCSELNTCISLGLKLTSKMK